MRAGQTLESSPWRNDVLAVLARESGRVSARGLSPLRMHPEPEGKMSSFMQSQKLASLCTEQGGREEVDLENNWKLTSTPADVCEGAIW